MEGRPGFWILPVFKATWNPNPAGHFPNQIIEISLAQEFPNIAPGLTVSLEIPGTALPSGRVALHCPQCRAFETPASRGHLVNAAVALMPVLVIQSETGPVEAARMCVRRKGGARKP